MRAAAFTDAVRDTLARRASYLCSNPRCRRPTGGPHSDPNRSESNGKAAHICAASPGGARYDAAQTLAERRSASNGIWLCSNCAWDVDRDEARFSKATLVGWKRLHEQYLANEESVPPVPVIGIETPPGLSRSLDRPALVAGDDVNRCREHLLTLRNVGHTVLHDLRADCQFPEPVLLQSVTNVGVPAGVHVDVLPDLPQWIVAVGGTGTVRVLRPTDACSNWKLSADRLVPDEPLTIWLVSRPARHPALREARAGEEALLWYVAGQVDYDGFGGPQRLHFIAPLRFDRGWREMSSQPCKKDLGTRRLVALTTTGE